MSARKILAVIAAIVGAAVVSVRINAQTISTYAGGGIFINAPALTVAAPDPANTAVAPDGTVYYTAGQSVYHLNPGAGTVTLVAGNGTPGYSGDGGSATGAELSGPLGVAVDAAGNLYIADTNNSVIRRVDSASGTITTIAGNHTYGYSGDGGPATSAALYFSQGVAVDAAGNLYIADTYNFVIRRVAAASGTITTIAGNHTYGYSGDGGPATSAELSNPSGVAVDAAGNLYIADPNNSVIRRVAAAGGTITTIAGNHTSGYSGNGGPATSAALYFPQGVAVDAAGNLYIADTNNSVIRRVAAAGGTITTVAGNHTSGYRVNGGPATSAALYFPQGVAVDAAGNLYIADTNNSVIRRVAAAGGTITTVAGNHTYGYSGNGGPATSAELSNLYGVAIDAAGNLYIADTNNSVIRRVAAAGGKITTVAGNHTYGYSGDSGPATSAKLSNPSGVAIDAAGNLYIADPNNSVIRRVAAASGTITTVAGNHTSGYSGDSGPATSAELSNPSGVAVDAAGNLYIADPNNSVIRRVAAASGTITTVAGNHTSGYSGDSGPATSAELSNPSGVAVDAAGNLYIADPNNSVIRRVAAASGTITTFAGNHTSGYSGDGGPAASAALYFPYGAAVDAVGNLYIADTSNNVIRRVAAASGTITTFAGNGTYGYSGDGGPATSAELSNPYSVTVDAAGNLYISDTNNLRIRLVSLVDATPPVITPTIGGTLGNNGWYTSNVTVSWSVTDPLAPVISQSGCGTTVISSDTAGQTLTCSATGQGGTATQSVTIARDATPPTVSITTPANGASYVLGSMVSAAYVCADGLAGVVSCVGPVTNGAPINTASTGNFAFAVTGTDVAGNTAMSSASYMVSPAFTTTPNLLSFGSETMLVASAPMLITVTNTAAVALPITSITLSTTSPHPFSQTNTCGTSVAVSATCTISVVFNPSSTGPKTATLSVNAGNGAGTQTVALSGTGVVAPYMVSPTSLAFGSETTLVASAPMLITVTNTAAVALPITSITLSTTSPHPFSQTNTCGTSVAVSATCTISVVFNPSSTGSKTAKLSVNAGNGAGTQTVALSGTGVVAPYTVAPTSLAFGSEPMLVASAPMLITVTNTAAVALPVTSITLSTTSPHPFSQTNTCGTSVAVSATCTISVVFNPSSTGSKPAKLNVNAGNGAGTQTVALSGTGVLPTYTVSPTSLAFGSEPTLVASAPMLITVTNTAAVALPITSISVSGNPGQFSQTNGCGASVAVGAACTISVVFNPGTTGLKTATLTVSAGDGAGRQTVALSGTGT